MKHFIACLNQNSTKINNKRSIGLSSLILFSLSIISFHSYIYGQQVENLNTSNTYTTIQAAVDDASPGDVLEASAGAYKENVVIDKSLTLKGANTGIAGTDVSRGAESIVYPLGGTGGAFTIQAGDVTIDGFNFDGMNPDEIASGYTIVNTTNKAIGVNGIFISDGDFSNLVIENNIIENFSYAGINFVGVLPSTKPATSENEVSNNLIRNLGTQDGPKAGEGVGIYVYRDSYTKIVDNKIENILVGIQTGEFRQANPIPNTDYQLIANNNIITRQTGIYHDSQRNTDVSPFTIKNNTITGLATDATFNPSSKWNGIILSILWLNEGTTVEDNTIDGGTQNATHEVAGYEAWNTTATANPMIKGGTVKNVKIGVYVNNYAGGPLGSSDAAKGTTATLKDITIQTADTAIKVLDDPLSTHVPVHLQIDSNVIVNDADIGLLIENDSASVTGCLPNLKFDNIQTNYIQLINNKNDINAIGTIYDIPTSNTPVSTMTPAQIIQVKAKVIDKDDDSDLGLVIFENPDSLVFNGTTLSNRDTVEVCFGDSISISTTGLNTDSYTLYRADFFTTVVPTGQVGDTTYLLQLSLIDDEGVYYMKWESLTGCSDIVDSFYLKVNDTPELTISSNNPLCTGDSLILEAVGDTGNDYSWSGPNGFSTISQDTVITNPDASNLGKYVVTADNGVCINKDSIEVEINSRPTVTASSIGPICAKDTLKLESVGNAGNSFSWSGPNGFTSNSQDTIIAKPDANNSGKYYVTIDDGLCTSIDSIEVLVNSLPTITATSNGTLCAGDTLTLHAVADAGNTFSWTGPDGFTSNKQDTLVANTTVINAGKYYVTVDNGTCTNIDSIKIPIDDFIPAVTATSNSPICIGDTLELKAEGSPGDSYNWSGPNGFHSADQNTIVPNVDFDNAGEYIVEVYVGGCSSTDTTEIVVNPIPNVIASSNSPIQNGDELKLTASGGITYNWTGPNNFYSTDQNPTTNSESGTYIVVGTDNIGCADTDTINVEVDPHELYIPQLFSPNNDGKNDKFVIIGLEKYPKNELWILNRWGDVVYKSGPYQNDWTGEANTGLNLSNGKLTPGTYYYVFYTSPDNKPEKGFVELTY